MAHGDKHGRDKMDKMLSDTPEEAYEQAQDMGMDEIHSHRKDGELMFMPGENHDEMEEHVGDEGTKLDAENCGLGTECGSIRARAGSKREVREVGVDVEADDFGGIEPLETVDENTDGVMF